MLCNSEEVSRLAACEVMAELYGLTVHPDEFIPFTGTGEANFLGEGGGQSVHSLVRGLVGQRVPWLQGRDRPAVKRKGSKAEIGAEL